MRTRVRTRRSRLLPDCLAHLRCRRARKAQAQAATVVTALEAIASGDGVEAVVASAPVSSPGSPDTQAPPTAASPSLPTLLLRQRDAGSGADLGRDILAVLALKRFTVEVKLPYCPTPASLPAGHLLADALHAWLGSSSSGSSVLLDTATVSIAPGCVRLIVDAFRDDVATGGGAPTAQHLAAVLRRTCGAAAKGAHAAGLCCDAAPAGTMSLSLEPSVVINAPVFSNMRNRPCLYCSLPLYASTASSIQRVMRTRRFNDDIVVSQSSRFSMSNSHLFWAAWYSCISRRPAPASTGCKTSVRLGGRYHASVRVLH